MVQVFEMFRSPNTLCLTVNYVVVITRCQTSNGKYFPSFSYFLYKYEKRGNYLPILHEETCNSYFIFKCLLKSNVTILILRTNCIERPSYNSTLT